MSLRPTPAKLKLAGRRKGSRGTTGWPAGVAGRGAGAGDSGASGAGATEAAGGASGGRVTARGVTGLAAAAAVAGGVIAGDARIAACFEVCTGLDAALAAEGFDVWAGVDAALVALAVFGAALALAAGLAVDLDADL